MNIEEEDEKIINIKPKGEKDTKEEEKKLLSKKRLRYNKVVKKYIFYNYNFYSEKKNLKKKKN